MMRSFLPGPGSIHGDAPPAPLQVRFDLHHTFANPQRVVEAQPYEVTETGWGEFDILIHVSGSG